MQRAAEAEVRNATAVVYLGLELGLHKWVLCFSSGAKRREIVLRDGDCNVPRLMEEAKKARKALKSTSDAKLVCCYEAGRHGFSVHRNLETSGVESYVVDSASIEVPRKKRHNKTDRIDARKLVQLLIRFKTGERDALHVVRIPSVEVEDERRPLREYDRLKRERTAQTNRIKSLLLLAGIQVRKIDRNFPELLEELRNRDNAPVPPNLLLECRHSFERRELVNRHLHELNKARRTRLAAQRKSERVAAKARHDHKARPENDPLAAMVLQLTRLVGIGETSAWMLVTEFFGWRKFTNRRQVVGASGLAPTTKASCTIERQGHISKAGNARVRWLMQQLAWLWLRLQPQSRLTRWRESRLAKGNKKSLSVAVAGRLIVDLWKWLEFGVVPDGALVRD